jgi:hypothetical protein
MAFVSSSPAKRIELPSTMRPGGSIRPRDGKAGDGLARARFAHQPQDLAGRHVEIDTVDGAGHAFLGEKVRA